MQPTDLQDFANWMAGENDLRLPVRSRSPDPEATLIQASISQSIEPRARPSQSFPLLTVQLLTRGRLPFRADFGCGRFSAVATSGAFIVTPPGQPCDIKIGANFESLGLAVPWSLVEELIAPAYDGMIPDLAAVYAGLARSKRVAEAMMALWSEIAVAGAPGRLLFQAEVLKVLGGLLQLASKPTEARAAGGLSPLQLARACEFIEANLQEDISLAQLAASAALSPTHFSRAFRQTTGMPPFAWLLQRRVERAKTLLDRPDLGLATIALEVGFAAQSQFTTAFRRATGVPPGAWRRSRDL